MTDSRPNTPNTKARLHPQNPHQGRYDMAALAKALPALQAFLTTTPAGETSIDFSNPKAVVCLNRALLKHVYAVENWSLPDGFLCPPIPGRVDYVLCAQDLLQNAATPKHNIRALDIGTGANLIYPMVATRLLNWEVVGSDINPKALENAQKIIQNNANLQGISLRLQHDATQIFHGIVARGERFDITLCNPPFFKSAEEAAKQAQRKWRNLKGQNNNRQRNFGGVNQELWCDGGEMAFLMRMVHESVTYARQITWFTTLVANQTHLPLLQKTLQKLGAKRVAIVETGQIGRAHV